MNPERPTASKARDAATAASLSWQIFARTLGAKYRKSYAGYFWMLAPAAAVTAGVTLASDAGVVAPAVTALPYSLFVFLGTLLWMVFSEAVQVPHQAFESARGYLTRVNFPREAIVLAQAYEALVTTGVRLACALLLLACTQGLDLRGTALIATSFFGAMLLGIGIGAVLMPFTQLFADLHQVIKLVLSYGLFLTPAMYVPQGDGLFAQIVRWNPVSPLMQAARDAAAGLPLTEPTALVVVLVAALLSTIVGLLLVRAVSPIVIERMLMGGR